MLPMISSIVQNDNLSTALNSQLCGSTLEKYLSYSPSHDKYICTLLHIISNVVQMKILVLHYRLNYVAVFLE